MVGADHTAGLDNNVLFGSQQKKYFTGAAIIAGAAL